MNATKSTTRLLALAVAWAGMMTAGPGRAEEPANRRKPEGEAELRYWLENMVWYHRFSTEEIIAATGLGEAEIDAALEENGISTATRPARKAGAPLVVLPYPGGRHPRSGFLEGAVRPQRETKVSVFAPWDDGTDYAVVDVPEAIRWQHGILYLAHTHVPTAWTEKNVTLPVMEWERRNDGTFFIERTLPNGILYGAKVEPITANLNPVAPGDGPGKRPAVKMLLWLKNGCDETLTDMRIQNCVMLKGMKGFNQLTAENKIFKESYAACRNEAGDRWIIMAWDPILKGWGNVKVPCLHSDPVFPDCAPGEETRARGWFSFYEGTDIEAEFERIEATGWRKW